MARRALLILAALSAVLAARAESNLLKNSPFLPTDQAAASSQQSAPLELRSIVMENGQFEFSLYDPAKKQSTWIKLNEPSHNLLVKTFDPVNNVVTVEHHSQTYTLALKEGRAIPLFAAPAPLFAAPDPQSPNSGSVQELETIRQSGANEEAILQELQRFRHRQVLANQHKGSERQAEVSPSTVSGP